MSKRKRSLLLMTALLVLLCLVFAACGDKKPDEAKEDPAVSTEQVQDSADTDEPEAVKTEDNDDNEVVAETPDTDTDTVEQVPEEPAKEDKSSKSSKSKDDSKKKTSKKKSSKDSGNSSSDKPKEKEKQKVWVPPVTETRTVTLDTGTRYCNGANSNGGCGASWHGTKDGTYSEWKSHWQAYVKKRTAEEAEKGKTYVCDHIHDDSRWVPDTTTEEVVVQEGYWKEVD